MKDGSTFTVGKQVLRSTTSVGTNLAEAQAAESTADPIHKHSIVLKKVRECEYWLSLLEKAELLPANGPVESKQETNEPIFLITAIILDKKRDQTR